MYRFIHLLCKLRGMRYVHKTSNHDNNDIFLYNLFLLRYILLNLVLFSWNSSSPDCLRHLLNFSHWKISFTLERQATLLGLQWCMPPLWYTFFYIISQVPSVLPQAIHAWLTPIALTEILPELFCRPFNMNTC